MAGQICNSWLEISGHRISEAQVRPSDWSTCIGSETGKDSKLISETDVIASRKEEITTLLNHIRDEDCCSIVGMSNIGKSELLRTVCEFEVQPRNPCETQANYLLVYVDLNLMLEMTEQGFYELVIRSLLAEMQAKSIDGGLRDRISRRPWIF